MDTPFATRSKTRRRYCDRHRAQNARHLAPELKQVLHQDFHPALMRAIYPAFQVLFPNQVIRAADLARAMVDVAVWRTGERGEVFERTITSRPWRSLHLKHLGGVTRRQLNSDITNQQIENSGCAVRYNAPGQSKSPRRNYRSPTQNLRYGR